MKRFLIVLCLSALMAATAFAATAPKPVLRIATLDGGTFELSAQRGKWVIVNFWATWCSPCIKELPDISAYVAKHKDHVAAIGLAYEDSDKADIENFLKAHPLSYPVAQLDTMNPPKDFDAPKALPNTYLIAPDGHIAKAFLGPIQMKDLDAIIAP